MSSDYIKLRKRRILERGDVLTNLNKSIIEAFVSYVQGGYFGDTDLFNMEVRGAMAMGDSYLESILFVMK